MPVAIFDLDGTLVDSWPEVEIALQATTESLNIDLPSRGVGDYLTDLSAPELLEWAGVRRGEDLEAAVRLFREHLAAVIGNHVQLQPGTDYVLNFLANAGYSLAVATNKPLPLAIQTLEAVGIHNRFSEVVGTPIYPPKPCPDMILACLEACGGSDGFVVGDSIRDVTAARHAQLRAFLLLGKGSQHSLLSDEEEVIVVKSLVEIPAFLADS